MNKKRQQILQWQQQGLIATKDVEKCLHLTQSSITGKQWYDFITKSLLLFGAAAMAAGVIFFFAYNWDNMSNFSKFALAQGLIISGSLLYSQLKSSSLPANATLLFVALLIGALLALFGQTYQTGKDPWQLFALWSLFVAPLAYVAKDSLLWILLSVLANVGLYLFFSVHPWFFGTVLNNLNIALIFALLNMCLAGVLFFVHKPKQAHKQTAAFYLTIIMAISVFTWLGAVAILTNDNLLYLFIFIVWMFAVYYFFRIKMVDVLILAAWSLSLIIALTALASRFLGGGFYGGKFLFLGIFLILASTFATKWLMGLLKQQVAEPSERQSPRPIAEQGDKS